MDDARELLNELNGNLSKLPLIIQGRVLEPSTLIEDARIANDELIVMEMKITFDPNDKN